MQALINNGALQALSTDKSIVDAARRRWPEMFLHALVQKRTVTAYQNLGQL